MKRRRRFGRMAPVARRQGAFKADFYSIDCDEPPHVHVRSGEGVAKIWLIPVSVQWERWAHKSTGRRAVRFVEETVVSLLRRWEEHCEGSR